MKKLFVVFIVALFFSCQGKKKVPRGIIQPQKMQQVLWDYIRADVFARDFIKKDSLRNDTIENLEMQNKVFAFYHISREDFYKSYDFYIEHPELMNAVMDSMIAKQNRFKLHTQQQKNNQRRFLPREKLFKAE